ncbi:hypothetical protein, partial [Rhizobium leguminosarum]|uniref:hypothetical protein n=1 Tax=Rhizobium leguminosarum TaxID=384 RepID=UPI00103A0C86
CQGTFALLAKAKSVTHVSGMNCHPSLGKDTKAMQFPVVRHAGSNGLHGFVATSLHLLDNVRATRVELPL